MLRKCGLTGSEPPDRQGVGRRPSPTLGVPFGLGPFYAKKDLVQSGNNQARASPARPNSTQRASAKRKPLDQTRRSDTSTATLIPSPLEQPN